MVEPVLLSGTHHLFSHKRLEIFVKDLLLEVCQRLEFFECLIEIVIVQFMPQFHQALLEGMASECLPSTRTLVLSPTDSGVMIS